MSANLMENFAALPADVREKLAELDLELSEGLLTINFLYMKLYITYNPIRICPNRSAFNCSFVYLV